MLSKQDFYAQLKDLITIQEELCNKSKQLKYADELYVVQIQKIENATKIMQITNDNFVRLFGINEKICSVPKFASVVYVKAQELLDDISYVTPKSPNDVNKIYELIRILKQNLNTFKLYHAYSPRGKRDDKFYIKRYIEDSDLPDAKEEKDEDYNPEEYKKIIKQNKINKPNKTLSKPSEDVTSFDLWFENSKKEWTKDGKLMVRKKNSNELLRIVQRTIHKVIMPDGTTAKRIHYKFE